MSFDMLSDIKELVNITGVPLYGDLVADKDNCMALIHTGGFIPEHTMGGVSNQKPAIIRPTFQIMMRGLSEHDMHGYWDTVINALDGKVNFMPSGTSRTYICIKQMSDIMDLGRDSNRRHLHVVNFETWIIRAR